MIWVNQFITLNFSFLLYKTRVLTSASGLLEQPPSQGKIYLLIRHCSAAHAQQQGNRPRGPSSRVPLLPHLVLILVSGPHVDLGPGNKLAPTVLRGKTSARCTKPTFSL